MAMNIDDKTRTELEAAAFRRLLEHLRQRTDVQNIDMMNLAGFCRNCLADWLIAADATLAKDAAREIVHGMSAAEWKASQPPASEEQLARMAASLAKNAASG